MMRRTDGDAALSQPAGASDGADEDQDQHTADGSGDQVQQAKAAQGYFPELLASNPNIDEGLRALLRLCRETVVRLSKTASPLVRDPIWSWIPCAGVVSSLTRSRLQPKMTAV